MEIDEFKRYKGRVDYKHTDDLNPNAPENGSIIYFTPGWIIEKTDSKRYAGQWAMCCLVHGVGWIPEEDLEDIQEVGDLEYTEAINKYLES